MVFLNDVGPSDEIRKIISETDVTPTSISLILDRPRTMTVIHKQAKDNELSVRCRDIEDGAIIVLHLPFQEGSRAQATIITMES